MESIPRRRFLGGALAASAGTLMAGCGARAERPSPAQPSSSEHSPSRAPAAYDDWDAVRSLFVLDPDVAHLSAFILAPHSRPVREQIELHRRGLDADAEGYRGANAWREEAAAHAAAGHLGARIDDIALTDSTTMGLGAFLGGLKLEPGDEVLTTAHEHFAARGALDLLAARTGAGQRRVELYPPARPERATRKGILAAIESGLGSRTRVVVVTWVHSASGVRLPIRDIAEVIARHDRRRSDERRTLLVVDGAHALGTGPLDVPRSGCDALIAGCHKWLLGPRGTGLIWARDDAWERTAPTIPSWSRWGRSRGGTSGGALMTPGGYHSFEHRWALAPAFELQRRIGQERIADRIDVLADRLRDALYRIDGVTVHVPAEHALRSGVVCFTVDGRGPQQVADALRDEHRVAASVTPYAVELARFGTHWITTEREVDRAIAAVTAIAR